MSILRLDHISRTFHERRVLDDLSLTVEAGDKLALIGDNGSGKSTLFNIITGTDETSEGSVRLAQNTVIAHLSQNPDPPLPGETALDNPELAAAEKHLHDLETQMAAGRAGELHPALAAAYHRAQNRFTALGGYDYGPRLAQVLAGLGVSGQLLDQPLSSLSGGERMRVELGRLLVGTPDLLLLDEPTNHLDVDGLEWLEDYIQRFAGTVIYISHDRTFIERTANKVAELLHGKITLYNGSYSVYEQLKAEAQAQARRTVETLSGRIAHESAVKQTLFSHRNFSGYHEREKRIARLSQELDEARLAVRPEHGQMNFRLLPSQAPGDPDRIILRTRDLGKSFDGRQLFSGLDFELKAGRKLVLAGPNGCGKSTLLRLFTGFDQTFEGEVWLSDRLTWSLMTQVVSFEDEDLTVYSELNRRTDLDDNGTYTLLARFGFTGLDVEKPIRVLSGGERSRLYLCCLLEENPDLLLLDEPTNHLDIHSREILEQALLEYNGAIIAVSHDRYFIDKIGQSILGFVGTAIHPFADYEAYRRATRGHAAGQAATAPDPSAPKPAERNRPRNQPRSQNPYKLRQEQARLTQSLRDAEAEISRIEQAQGEVEAGLGPDSPPEDYVRLAELLEAHEAAQEHYLESAIALEEFTAAKE